MVRKHASKAVSAAGLLTVDAGPDSLASHAVRIDHPSITTYKGSVRIALQGCDLLDEEGGMIPVVVVDPSHELPAHEIERVIDRSGCADVPLESHVLDSRVRVLPNDHFRAITRCIIDHDSPHVE